MRILQVTPALPPTRGGVERHVAALSDALVRRGHEVSILSADARDVPPDADLPERPGLRVVRLPGRTVGPFLAVPGLRPALRELAADCDVVHVHNLHSPLPIQVLRAGLTTPVVVTGHFHGSGHSLPARAAHRAYIPAVTAALTAAAAVVAVSDDERATTERVFPHLRGRVQVIPNGLRPLLTGPAAGSREPTIICVSRLVEYKRVGTLVEALAMIPGTWSCTIVGDGPLRDRLRSQTQRLGIASRVALRDDVDDDALNTLLAAARVGVQPSSKEAFGLALLEGLASGCRMVASDIAAHRQVGELVEAPLRLWDASTGAEGLAQQIAEALSDPADPQEAVHGGVPRGIPTWDGVAAQVEHVYTQVLQSDSASAGR